MPIDSRRFEGIEGFKMTKERTHHESCGEWIEGFDQSKIDYTSINVSNNMLNAYGYIYFK